MSALHGVNLEDPRWFQNTVQDPDELRDLVRGKDPGTFAVGKKGTDYFLVHTLQTKRASVKNLSRLIADGTTFDEIRRIHDCTRPYFKELVKTLPEAMETNSAKAAQKKRPRSPSHSASAQPIKKKSFSEQMIQEFQDRTWYVPDLSQEEIITELNIAPSGTYLVSKNEFDGYTLYWTRYSVSHRNDETRCSDLLIDKDQLYLMDYPDLQFDSFDALKRGYELEIPFSTWQQKQAERAANYQALEDEAALPDDPS